MKNKTLLQIYRALLLLGVFGVTLEVSTCIFSLIIPSNITNDVFIIWTFLNAGILIMSGICWLSGNSKSFIDSVKEFIINGN